MTTTKETHPHSYVCFKCRCFWIGLPPVWPWREVPSDQLCAECRAS